MMLQFVHTSGSRVVTLVDEHGKAIWMVWIA